ncbi:MAG TPA: hypothetical protein PK324_15905, partial [Nocardioides sp.]|nr:hypothetical protein [Nocardioides sp.]
NLTPSPRSSAFRISSKNATARALAAYLLRGLDCGAVDAAEVVGGCGLSEDQLRALARPRG